MNSWNPVLTYVLLTAALSTPWYVVSCMSSLTSYYSILLMWSPGLAALLTTHWRGLSVDDLGWKWAQWNWNVYAYLLPFFYAFVGYTIVWATGLGGFGNPHYVKEIRKDLDMSDSIPAWLVVCWQFFLLGTGGIIKSVSSALGEEIGWRGFLAPNLVELVGFTKGCFITGMIWALWHYPIIIGSSYSAGTPVWYQLLFFTIFVVSLTIVATWLRIRSGSLWPAAIIHGSHNLWIQGFFTPITLSYGKKTAYSIDEFGFVLPIVSIPVAYYIWKHSGITSRETLIS